METNDIFSKVFSYLVDKSGYKDAEIARRLDVNRSTINRWKSGELSPKLPKIKEISEFFGVNPLVFVDEQYSLQLNSVTPHVNVSVNAPIYGTNNSEFVEIPENIGSKFPNAFLLSVHNSSMNKVVPNGAYALIDPISKDEVNNGDIIAIQVNGGTPTLKRFYKLQNTIVLEPDSYDDNQVANTYTLEKFDSVKILGRTVWFMANPDSVL